MKRACFSLVILFLGAALATAGAQSAPTLDQAAAAASAGHTDDAIQMYRAILQQEPENATALSALSGLLQGEGKWRESIPILERLVKLNPGDPALLYQLGRYKSWESEKQHDQGAELLRRACETSDHNPEFCGAYADVLSWHQETRAEAVSRLQQVLKAHPDSMSARLRLGQVLSWNDATRAEGLSIFDEGLKIEPKNVDLLLASAEVLSWSGPTRTEAMARYDRVLQQDPENIQALNAKAQLLAWHHQSAEALVLYARVLANDPKNPVALRGKAEILNWKGHYVEARALAAEAHTEAPSDAGASLELARAYIGLQRFAQARQAIADVNGTPSPDFNDVRNEIHRGTGTYIDLGYAFRQQPNHASTNLEYHRFDVALSTPLGQSNRVTFVYQPTLYTNFQQGFNSNYFGASLDSSISDRLSTHAQVGAEVFQNVPINVDGAFGAGFKLLPSTTLKFNFQRQAVEESLLSTLGTDSAGLFLGQVYSNLADVGISYSNPPHKLDMSLDYTDGVYTGRGLDPNRRYSFDFQIGRSIHSDQPYIRIGYYGNYTSFDHDADIQNGVPLSPSTGGYFSPTSYLLNQGVIAISHRFGKKVQWGMSGGAGVQNVENSTSSFSNTQFASSFETHLMWRVTPTNELRLGYDYLNVFNAFERNLFRFSWRIYF